MVDVFSRLCDAAVLLLLDKILALGDCRFDTLSRFLSQPRAALA